MATPHLTSEKDTANPRLNSMERNGNGHLLILRRTVKYNNTEMVVTPKEERFVAVAAWGKSSYYNTAVSNYVAQDAAVLVNNLTGKFDAMTGENWTVGHKNIFAYYARSGCPARCAFYRSGTATDQQQYLEFAATRNVLKFDLKAIPWGEFSALSVYLRFHNPSAILYIPPVNVAQAFDFAHNDTSDIMYSFRDSLGKPSDLTAGNFGYCRFCGGFANRGAGGNGGTAVGFGNYDPWDLSSKVSGNTLRLASVIKYCYTPASAGEPVTEWYADHQITDANVLNDLRQSSARGNPVYLAIGPRIANGISSSQAYGVEVGNTFCVFATRVELVLKVTNNTNTYN